MLSVLMLNLLLPEISDIMPLLQKLCRELDKVEDLGPCVDETLSKFVDSGIHCAVNILNNLRNRTLFKTPFFFSTSTPRIIISILKQCKSLQMVHDLTNSLI